jgi:FdhD protein
MKVIEDTQRRLRYQDRSHSQALDSLEASPSIPWPVQRIRQDQIESLEDRVPLEEPFEIVVNGRSIAVLMRLPGQEKELAAGFCITEGYVRHVTDILLIHHCGSGLPAPGEQEQDMGSRNRVTLRVTPDGFVPPERPDVVRLIRSGCGAADVTALSETLPLVDHGLRVETTILLSLSRAMRAQQAVHRTVGGTHAAVLFDTTGRAIAAAEDIGRHNAIDKAVGYCLLRGISPQDKVLLTSGRASYEMATKAVRVGIPIIASVSAPTSLAVQLAEDRGLTLIGYLRGGRMSVYTHPERIAGLSN